jgi:hypothetical protein
MTNRLLTFVSLLAGAACLTGCSSGDIGTVTGTVKMDGQPLKGARVTFYPIVEGDDAFSNAGTSIGRTDENGVYELIFGRGVKGAKVGKHTVHIETGEDFAGGYGGEGGSGRQEEVPKKYNSESELVVEVSGGSNTIDFLDLTSEGDKNRVRDLDSGKGY